MLLSIGMIIKNEEKYLDQCLTAIKPLLNQLKAELVIVDTGSTDKSVEIAKKYTKNIYHFDWINDFAAARNYSLSKCHGEWFMYLDGDEVLDNANELIAFFKSGEYKNYVAASHQKREYSNVEEKRYLMSSCVRIFKNDNIKFVSPIHEYVNIEGPIKNLEQTFYHHYGYVGKSSDKIERNYEYLKEAIKNNPYELYTLSYYFINLNADKQYEEIIERYEDLTKHISISEEGSNSMNKILEYAFKAYLEKNQIDKCLALLDVMKSRVYSMPIVCRMYAWLSMHENDQATCEEYLNEYFKCREGAIELYDKYGFLYSMGYLPWCGSDEVALYNHYLDVNKEAKLNKDLPLSYKQAYLEYAIKHQYEMWNLKEYLSVEELKLMSFDFNDFEVYDYIMNSEEELDDEVDLFFVMCVLHAGLKKKPTDETKVLYILNNYMEFCTYYQKHYDLPANSLFYAGYYLKTVDLLLDEDKPNEALVHLKDVIGWDNSLAYAIKIYLKAKGY